MSGNYKEYISGIRIEYENKLNLCEYNDCFYIKGNKLQEIENNIADIAYTIKKKELDRYDQEEEETITCECGNEIKFTYNPYELIIRNF
jgi:hypothetical protein